MEGNNFIGFNDFCIIGWFGWLVGVMGVVFCGFFFGVNGDNDVEEVGLDDVDLDDGVLVFLFWDVCGFFLVVEGLVVCDWFCVKELLEMFLFIMNVVRWRFMIV